MNGQSICWFTATEPPSQDQLLETQTSRENIFVKNIRGIFILDKSWKSTQFFITIDHWMDLRFRDSHLTLQLLFKLQCYLHWRQSAGKSIGDQKYHISIRVTPGVSSLAPVFLPSPPHCGVQTSCALMQCDGCQAIHRADRWLHLSSSA